MITIKSTSCRLMAEGGGVILYRVVTKVTDGQIVATFRRYRLITSWADMNERNRRAYFREEVNAELFETLDNYDSLREHWHEIIEAQKEATQRSRDIHEAYNKCASSPYGFWELYDFSDKEEK